MAYLRRLVCRLAWTSCPSCVCQSRLEKALAAGDLALHRHSDAAIRVAHCRQTMCRVWIPPGAFRGAITVTCESVQPWTICPSPRPEMTIISSYAPLLY